MRLTLLLVVMIGCGPDLEASCLDYVAAQAACWDQVGAAYDTGLDLGYTDNGDDVCAIVVAATKTGKRRVAESYQCQADVYRTADCTTLDAASSADLQALGQCL